MVDVKFRTMKSADFDFYSRLIDMTGWGLDARDFERMLSYEPHGCFIASLEGEDVGMVASFLYGEVGWIGNLVTLPERRGRGVGAALMTKAIGRLQREGAKSVRLDAVVKAVPLYERLGFGPEYRSLRFIGAGRSASSGKVSPMRTEDLDAVIGLDRRYFGLRRERMLRRVLRDFHRLCFVSRVGGRIVGFIMAKEGSESLRVGPWICDPERVEEAEYLLHAVVNEVDGKRVWVGVPEGNRESVGILRRDGFDELPSSLRMCLGTCSTVEDSGGIFGIGAAEKG